MSIVTTFAQVAGAAPLTIAITEKSFHGAQVLETWGKGKIKWAVEKYLFIGRAIALNITVRNQHNNSCNEQPICSSIWAAWSPKVYLLNCVTSYPQLWQNQEIYFDLLQLPLQWARQCNGECCRHMDTENRNYKTLIVWMGRRSCCCIAKDIAWNRRVLFSQSLSISLINLNCE